MEDLSRYVGIRYVDGGRDIGKDSGLDCYGLCIALYADLFDIHLPDYAHITADKCGNESCSKLLHGSATYQDFDQVDTPKFGDLIILRSKGTPLHIGFVLDNTNMLHCNTGTGSVIESFRSIRWKNKISGFYRHKSFSR
jgi:cell wall-associated NlpC family hydrolase